MIPHTATITAIMIAAALLWWSAAAVGAQGTLATPPVPGLFVDATAASGIQFRHAASRTAMKYELEMIGSGAALFDYDNDGRLDIFLVNGAPIADPTAPGTIPVKTGPKYWNRLYHQKADGSFEDVTERAGLQGVGYGMGVAVGDYDNDGYEDLYVTAYGGNRLYHNNGDGSFTDITEHAGVAGGGWSTGAAWVDLDNDGLLDLVVLRYLQWDFLDPHCSVERVYCGPDYWKPIAPLVFHNDGHGRFSDVTQKSGLDKPAKGLGIAIADYDRDGHIDLYIANDNVPEFLYHNNGDGSFAETALLAGAAVGREGHTFAGMGVDFADYDNDGFPDIAVDDLALQAYALFHNARDGSFEYVSDSTAVAAITMSHSGWGLRFVDYDNDGRKDLLVAQGHVMDTIERKIPQLHFLEPMLLLRNTGSGFVDVSGALGAVFNQRWAARGLAIGDIDNDGRLDAVVSTNDGPAHVLYNKTATRNHWLTLTLVGHRSNRDGIGAVVELSTKAFQQFSTCTTAGSYLSSGDKRVHFGLGPENMARQLVVRWPSGTVQTLQNVRGDRTLVVEEPQR